VILTPMISIFSTHQTLGI